MTIPDVFAYMARFGGQYPVLRQDPDSLNRVIYIGVAPRGSASSASAWKIFFLTYTGENLTLVQSSLEDQIWDNRVGLTYA